MEGGLVCGGGGNSLPWEVWDIRDIRRDYGVTLLLLLTL